MDMNVTKGTAALEAAARSADTIAVTHPEPYNGGVEIMRIWNSPKYFCSFLLALSLGVFSSRGLLAQEEIRPLRLDGITVNGLHAAVTESWVTLKVTVVNPNATGREGRVVVFYPEQPDVQYARDFWIPAQSSFITWMLVGATPGQPAGKGLARARELQALIYDRSGNQERLLLPRSEERVRSWLLNYRPLETHTCVLTDSTIPEDAPAIPGKPEPVEKTDEIHDLVRAFRAGASLSPNIHVIHEDFFPATANAFDGVDQFVLASRRLSLDPPGQVALRRWVEQGGKLWVVLDRTDPDLVARILGGVAGFHVVDRTSLTNVRIEGRGSER